MMNQLDLFSNHSDKNTNLLPRDGEAYYYGQIIPAAQADELLKILLAEIAWRQDEAIIFGKKILTKRKVAWYGDRPFEYTYSRTTKLALPWTTTLLEIKKKVESISGDTFNSCLLNYYHNGTEGMAWHSDGEPDLLKDGPIGSLSFGAARKFAFKHKATGLKVSQILPHGSLLMMRGTTQTHWLHRLPPVAGVVHPRVNLTFRTIVEE